MPARPKPPGSPLRRSEHYFPWLGEQGHAPFAWAVLGGLAEATRTLGLMTAVTCPILRYHPAQAAATLGVMTNNRFTLGLGAGERLNEHVVGAGWPGVAERHERLREAVDIIQGLAGALSTYSRRHFRLDHAKIFDPPSKKLPVILAAGGEDAAALAADACDGLIVTEPKRESPDDAGVAPGSDRGGAGTAAARMAGSGDRGVRSLAQRPLCRHERAHGIRLSEVPAGR
jgi:G6PDH family F420-dependent oxidoreductase